MAASAVREQAAGLEPCDVENHPRKGGRPKEGPPAPTPLSTSKGPFLNLKQEGSAQGFQREHAIFETAT